MAATDLEQQIFGRVPELDAVEGWLAGLADRPIGLVLEGEAGIGKTTLWREAVRRADARGLRVLTCRPAESEVKLALSALADLLHPVGPAQLGKLPVPQRHALEVTLLRIDAPSRKLDRRLVAAAFLSLLRILAEEGPVVLAVDDLQWLDAPSARTLEFALRRLEGSRVGLLATVRLGEVLPAIALPDDRISRVRLGPLTLAALHHLLLRKAERSFPRLALLKIQEASGGNPFYALEIARTLVRSGAAVQPGESLPVPETLAALLSQRIAALPASARGALGVAALAVTPSLETMTRAGHADPIKVLEPAVREGIVALEGTAIRFRHPLLASAVVVGMSRERIRAIHAMLADGAGSEEARARHLGLAAAGPDRRAADALEMAASLARRRGAPIAAGELLELAKSLTPEDEPDKSTARTHQAAQCYFEAGEADRAESLLEALVRSVPRGPNRARALQLLGQIRARSNSFPEAYALGLQALEEASDDALLRAEIELDLGFSAFCLGDLGGAASHMAAALMEAERTGADAIRAEALADLTIAEFFCRLGVSEARMVEALALEDPLRPGPLELRPRFVQALLLLWTGRLGESVATLLALYTEAIERGQEQYLPFLHLYLVIASLWSGDLPAASQFAEKSMEDALLNDEPVARALALSAQALVGGFASPPERTLEQAEQALALFQDSGFAVYTTWPLLAMGFLELSLGNPQRVDELLRSLADNLTATDLGDPILGIFLPDEIEALAALGDFDRARKYADWLGRGGRKLDRPWALAMAARGRAIIAAAQGDLDSALTALEQALIEHRRLPMPFELGRTLLIKGQVHRRRKQRRLAGEALAESARIFEHVGAPRWAARARAELGRVGLRAKAPGDLTATERRIASLAAAGLTNREVAKSAFISTKTVEANLGRVYAKLGIRSRAQLAHALDALKTESMT